MSEEPKNEVVDKNHVDMWIHYNTIRQQKNGNFLTAHTLLAAIAAFSIEPAAGIIWAISLLGIIIGIAWFILLSRNDAYIKFHRDLAAPNWRPKTWTPSSSVLDHTLPVAFTIFWFVLLTYSLVYLGWAFLLWR
jgi:hypothetical protein